MEELNPDLYKLFPKKRLHAYNAAYLGIQENLIKKLNASTMNAVDEKGCTALMKAAYKGHAHIVYHLISIKADALAVDNQGNTALDYACLNGHLAIVKALVSHTPVSVDGIGQNTTPLINAAYSGHIEIIQYLLENGANVNKMINGKSAVMIACWMFHFNIAALLVEAGAQVHLGSVEWVKRGVIFYRKIAFEQNVWTSIIDDENTASSLPATGAISLKEKMSYLTAEENDTMSRMESYFSSGKECNELSKTSKPPDLVNSTPSGRRVSRRRSISNKNRQALNLDVCSMY